MFYSKYCEYTIRALSYLSVADSNEKYTMVREISSKTNIPYHYLSKIFQDLACTDWVISKKGKNGGFTLAINADDLKLIDIIKWSDGIKGLSNCLIGEGKICERNIKCDMELKCSNLKNQIFDFFDNVTIKYVGEKMKMI